MIQVIAGKKGSGKTKRLIDLTNTTARDAIHDVIFLDDDNRYMFDVDHKVRFINAEDYHIHKDRAGRYGTDCEGAGGAGREARRGLRPEPERRSGRDPGVPQAVYDLTGRQMT